jgi:hypothetical protein
MGKQLKDRLYRTELALFVGINLFLLSIGISGKELTLDVPKIWKNLSSIDLQEGTFIFLLSILAVALSGMVPSEWKFTLIFWKLKNVKPASEAFTKWMFEDDRVDIKVLQKKYKNLPTSPKEQNSLWYRMYKKHQEKPSVIDAHRNFLLMRDLATISFIFILIFGLYILIRANYSFRSFIVFLIFFVEYIIFCISARNYGIRFVCNVLAEESSEIES